MRFHNLSFVKQVAIHTLCAHYFIVTLFMFTAYKISPQNVRLRRLLSCYPYLFLFPILFIYFLLFFCHPFWWSIGESVPLLGVAIGHHHQVLQPPLSALIPSHRSYRELKTSNCWSRASKATLCLGNTWPKTKRILCQSHNLYMKCTHNIVNNALN